MILSGRTSWSSKWISFGYQGHLPWARGQQNQDHHSEWIGEISWSTIMDISETEKAEEHAGVAYLRFQTGYFRALRILFSLLKT